ncbi:hypothetical protein Tco_0453007 [Tanacetum coccineum]
MAALESCPKHNMIAYLEKTEGNVEFHEVIDFLQRSYIFHALTVSPVISTTFVEQFWTSAKSKTINNVRHITAKVADKVVSISEASIRTELILNDADGIDSLPNQAIFNAIQRMGYEGDLSVLTFNKALFSPQWRQLANIDVPLDHFPVNSLTSKVFSFMVKKGKHFSGKITPLFENMLVQPTQEEGASLERPSKAQPSPSPTSTSEAPNESLPDSSSAQPSEVPFEQHSDFSPSPSPRPSPQPSPTPIVPDSIPEHTVQAKEIKLLKAKISKLKKKATPVIKHFKEYQKRISKEQRQQRKRLSKKKRVQQESVSKQGRKNAKGDGKAKENAQSEGRSKEMMNEDKENDEVSLSTEDEVSTAKEEMVGFEDKEFDEYQTETSLKSTEYPKLLLHEQVEGTDEHNESYWKRFFQRCEEEKFKQLESDEELARKIQEEWEAEEERNKIAEEKATNEALIKNFDDIKARIEADRILAEKLQEQEREQFTIEERAKFLHDTIAAQRKFLARQRSEAIRNRPPTKN